MGVKKKQNIHRVSVYWKTRWEIIIYDKIVQRKYE